MTDDSHREREGCRRKRRSSCIGQTTGKMEKEKEEEE